MNSTTQLDQSKRLDELGVDIETKKVWYAVKQPGGKFDHLLRKSADRETIAMGGFQAAPAYSFEELGKWLANNIEIKWPVNASKKLPRFGWLMLSALLEDNPAEHLGQSIIELLEEG